MIRKQGYLCGKCLKIYKTKHEAFRCESKCLDDYKSNQIYNIFIKLYDELKNEKGNCGYKFFNGLLLNKLIVSKTLLNSKQKPTDNKGGFE